MKDWLFVVFVVIVAVFASLTIKPGKRVAQPTRLSNMEESIEKFKTLVADALNKIQVPAQTLFQSKDGKAIARYDKVPAMIPIAKTEDGTMLYAVGYMKTAPKEAPIPVEEAIVEPDKKKKSRKRR